MSNSIQTLCREAIDRLGIVPAADSLRRIAEFAGELDQSRDRLDTIGRIELENAAVEYATAWAAAEMFEAACGQQGPLTKSGRPNPLLIRAASARTRMRQALKAIKSLLKRPNATVKNSVHPPRTDREGEACPPRRAPAEPPQPSTNETAIALAPIGEGDVENDAIGVTPAEPPHPATQPTAPPMNRAQRRAQARLEAKHQRKAAKRQRHKDKLARERSGTSATPSV